MSNFRSMHRLYIAAAFLLCISLTGCGGTEVSETDEAAAPASEEAIESPSPKGKILPAEERDPNRLWCKEHGVYEDECLICHPELADKLKAKTTERDPNRLWCNEHSVYEDECLICHPELADKLKAKTTERDPNRLWCNEHSVYEDECFICHPELEDKNPEPIAPSNKTSSVALQCKEHGVPEMECGICHPERVAIVPVGNGMKVRFVSDASTVKAGVASSVPASTAVNAQELLGVVTFDQERLASISPLTDGVLTEVLKETGDAVAEGEIVATMQSPALAEARSALQKATAEAELAQQTLMREKDLHARQISARQDLELAQATASVAQAAVAEAAQRLDGLGVGEAEAGPGQNALLSVRAPFNGTVIERTATRGTAAAAGEPLYRVADLTNMWMTVSVPESMLASVQSGGKASARFDAYPGLAFEGAVRWVSPRVDPETRMLEARVELPNPQGLLKDGLFGRLTLQGHGDTSVVSIPASAVQDVDGNSVVFRKLEDDLFEARRIEVGARNGLQAMVLAGLSADEEIVTEGSYIVKSELLKARLGAGCTDE